MQQKHPRLGFYPAAVYLFARRLPWRGTGNGCTALAYFIPDQSHCASLCSAWGTEGSSHSSEQRQRPKQCPFQVCRTDSCSHNSHIILLTSVQWQYRGLKQWLKWALYLKTVKIKKVRNGPNIQSVDCGHIFSCVTYCWKPLYQEGWIWSSPEVSSNPCNSVILLYP